MANLGNGNHFYFGISDKRPQSGKIQRSESHF